MQAALRAPAASEDSPSQIAGASSPDAIRSDNFETSIAGRWVTTDAGQTPAAPRWSQTSEFGFSPTHSITDSAGADGHLRTRAAEIERLVDAVLDEAKARVVNE